MSKVLAEAQLKLTLCVPPLVIIFKSWHVPAFKVTVKAPADELLSKNTLSERVGAENHPEPQLWSLRLVVVEASRVPAQPIQYLSAITF